MKFENGVREEESVGETKEGERPDHVIYVTQASLRSFSSFSSSSDSSEFDIVTVLSNK